MDNIGPYELNKQMLCFDEEYWVTKNGEVLDTKDLFEEIKALLIRIDELTPPVISAHELVSRRIRADVNYIRRELKEGRMSQKTFAHEMCDIRKRIQNGGYQ